MQDALEQLIKMNKLSLFVVVSMCLCSCSSYTGMSSISGKVIDMETRAPVSEVRIELVPGPSTTSGSDGIFRFYDIEPYSYTITAQKQGYEFNRKGIDAIAGKDVEIIIELKRLEDE